jgi:dihydrofolate reductase
MRELIADLFVSLDGHAFGEGAPAYFGYLGPDLERRIDDNVAEPQVMLMGRKTYEMMWAIVRDQPVEGGDRMDELHKVVFSGTVSGPLEWDNSRLAKGDLVFEVRSLKAEGGDALRTIGSISVVKALLETELLARLRLVVFPQILGETGREWIFDGLHDIDLKLVGTDVLAGRLVTLEHRPTGKDIPRARTPDFGQSHSKAAEEERTHDHRGRTRHRRAPAARVLPRSQREGRRTGPRRSRVPRLRHQRRPDRPRTRQPLRAVGVRTWFTTSGVRPRSFSDQTAGAG